MWNHIPRMERPQLVVVAVASGLSCAVGASVAHILTKRTLTAKYEEIVSKEIAEAKAFYQQRNKTGEYADPSKLAEKYSDEEEPDEGDIRDEEMLAEVVEKIQELKYHSTPLEDDNDGESNVEERLEVKSSIRKNIFDNRDPILESEEDEPFDVEWQKANVRTYGVPYIISHDEFYENDPEHVQSTLTYFDGDDVLTDDADQPIREIDKLIGSSNLRFGFGSKDKNIVYIRNEKFEADYEIVRSAGSYTVEVLGILQHSDEPRRRGARKFRDPD